MCVGCRRRAPASDLLRVVAVGHTLVPDPDRTRPGRGANLHPDPACLALAERRRAFGRALRLTGIEGANLDTGVLVDYVRRGHARQQAATVGNTDDVAGRPHPDQN